jgi:leucyl/phenylalanyl-tRNA--protein transferase
VKDGSDELTVEDLLTWYEEGLFPMAEARDDDRVFLIDPEARGVIPLGGFHTPRRLARTVRQNLYQVRIDTAFDAVVGHCATAQPDRPDTWINRPIQTLYRELFARGFAHSVECDASKVALVHLIARLKVGRYHLLDTQFLTEHLAQFGAVDIPRADYRRRLATAMERDADFYRFPAYADGEAALQAISHAS